MKAQHIDTTPCGLLLVAIGLLIRYHIGRRRFNRRTWGGLQQFSNYGAGLLTTIIESTFNAIGKLMLWVGLVLLAVAGVHYLIAK